MFNIENIIDLSLPLMEDTPIYPGDPKPYFSIATTLENEGYNLFNLVLGSQSGSHVDGPYHFNNNGSTIDKVNLKLCLGQAVVIDVSGKQKNEKIALADIAPYASEIDKVRIVLFRTDWYKKIGTDEFFEHPYLAEEAGQYLLNKGIKTLAIDTINLDQTGGTHFPIHDMYAAGEGLIAENLANFDKINFTYPLISVLPLSLVGCDGSPVRAVAFEILN
jgi:kynurenine formamidase